MNTLWSPLPVFTLTTRQFAGGKALRVVFAILLIPAVFAAIFAFVPDPNETPISFLSESLFRLLFIATLLPVGVLILATGALGNEIEDQTLPYLTLKPISRLRIILEKLGATVVAAVPMAWFGLALAYVFVLQGDALDAEYRRYLLAMFVSSFFGILAYASVFMLVSLYAARALLAGITYVLVWESLLGRYLPGLRVVSIRHFSESIYVGLLDNDHYKTVVRPSDPLENPTGLVAAMVTILMIALIAIILSARRLKNFNLE